MLRGHEVQQLYICSLLVKLLKDIELHGGIVGDNEILVIPSVNYPAMNVGKHFWSTDNSDINRLFLGMQPARRQKDWLPEFLIK